VQEEIEKQVDRHRGETEEYKVGDIVLLNTRDLKWQMVGKRTDKLTERFVGPYRMKKIISPNTIELVLPNSVRIHPVVNINRIHRYRDQVKEQKIMPSLPAVIEGEMKYEMEKILSKRKRYRKIKYLVQWKGYMAEEDTWEKKENLGNAQEALKDYEKGYKEAARCHELPGPKTCMICTQGKKKRPLEL